MIFCHYGSISKQEYPLVTIDFKFMPCPYLMESLCKRYIRMFFTELLQVHAESAHGKMIEKIDLFPHGTRSIGLPELVLVSWKDTALFQLAVAHKPELGIHSKPHVKFCRNPGTYDLA